MEPDVTAFSHGSKRAGLNMIRFLLESLVDLDLSLKRLRSHLVVLKGLEIQGALHLCGISIMMRLSRLLKRCTSLLLLVTSTSFLNSCKRLLGSSNQREENLAKPSIALFGLEELEDIVIIAFDYNSRVKYLSELDPAPRHRELMYRLMIFT